MANSRIVIGKRHKGSDTMPAIQAYKYDGKIIPVDDAKIGKAYQCPWTKKVFSTKRTYVKHLKDLRVNRMHKSAEYKRWHRLAEDLWSQPNFEKIVDWVELHPQWFLINAKRRGWSSDAKRYDKLLPKFSIKITYLNLRWDECVSNSHSRPHDGVIGGWGDDDAPKGYPGWKGRIEFQISHEVPGFGSYLMEGTRINTGTGGSGDGLNFGYEVRLYASDWPGLEKGLVWEALKGANMNRVEIGSKRYFR